MQCGQLRSRNTCLSVIGTPSEFRFRHILNKLVNFKAANLPLLHMRHFFLNQSLKKNKNPRLFIQSDVRRVSTQRDQSTRKWCNAPIDPGLLLHLHATLAKLATLCLDYPVLAVILLSSYNDAVKHQSGWLRF